MAQISQAAPCWTPGEHFLRSLKCLPKIPTKWVPCKPPGPKVGPFQHSLQIGWQSSQPFPSDKTTTNRRTQTTSLPFRGFPVPELLRWPDSAVTTFRFCRTHKFKVLRFTERRAPHFMSPGMYSLGKETPLFQEKNNVHIHKLQMSPGNHLEDSALRWIFFYYCGSETSTL